VQASPSLLREELWKEYPVTRPVYCDQSVTSDVLFVRIIQTSLLLHPKLSVIKGEITPQNFVAEECVRYWLIKILPETLLLFFSPP